MTSESKDNRNFLQKIFSRKAAPPVVSDAQHWQNWSGRYTCEPASQVAPQSLAELVEVVKSAPGNIRPVGSGHSFGPLVPTDGTIISVAAFKDIRDLDPETKEVTIGTGWCLHDLGEPLQKIGLGLRNQGDIDKQTLGGVVGTSTHGTGAELTSFSGAVTGLELVTAAGDVLWCDKDHNPDVFRAAQVSFGSLGVITAVRVKCQDAYLLERKEWAQPLEEVLDNLDKITKENRNVEFFFVPYADVVDMISLNVAPANAQIIEKEPEKKDPLKMLDKVHHLLGWSKRLHRKVLNTRISMEKFHDAVDWSYKIYPTERNTRFHDMEYQLPYENGPAAMREIRDTIYNQKLDISFPIEFRVVAGDDAWLSPFYGRKSCSIAIHQFADRDPMPYFNVIESILRKHGGRPHWGKLHTLSAKELAPLYPKWDDFLKVREKLDPEGKFLNAHLAKMLGVAAKASAPKPKIQDKGAAFGQD